MKIKNFQWRYSLLFLLGFSLFRVETAQAIVKCDNSKMGDITFYDINSQSTQTDNKATFSIKCENTSEQEIRGATICVSIGPQRQMINGSATLNFQLYKDLNYSTILGSEYEVSSEPYKFNVVLGPKMKQEFSATFYGLVLPRQTGVIPGKYQQVYPGNNNASVTVNAPNSNIAPNICNTGRSEQLEFKLTVHMIENCQVTTTGDFDLGSIMSGSTPTIISSSANLINVTCTNGTPYNIGLSSVNNSGNNTGAGIMKGTGTNTDIVQYQLQSNISGKIWGNTATSIKVGNGVAGIGSGFVQEKTVFATVSNTDVKPDNYSDIVNIRVNY